jgi:hypothetical protein
MFRPSLSGLVSYLSIPEVADFRLLRAAFSYPMPDRLRGSSRFRTAPHHPLTLPRTRAAQRRAQAAKLNIIK